MHTAKIQENLYVIDTEKSTINESRVNYHLEKINDGGYMFTLNGKKWIADLVKIDKENKQVTLRIQSKKINVKLKEPVDILLEKLGMQNMSTKKVNNLKAPMPGLVAKILVKEGDEVKQGDPLLILEAMKMENVFKAPADVVIKNIKVTEKQAVEKNTELITFA